MTIDPLTKMNLNKYIKENIIGQLYYEDFTDIIKKTKYKEEDIINYLIEKVLSAIESSDINQNTLNKFIDSIISIASKGYNEYISLNKEQLEKVDSIIENFHRKETTESQEINNSQKELINKLEELINKNYPNRYLIQEPKNEELNNLTQQNQNLTEELIQHKNQISELEKEQKSKEKKIKKLTNQTEELKATNEKLIASNNDQKEKIKDQRKELEILKQKLSEQEKTIKTVDTLNQIIISQEEQINIYKEEENQRKIITESHISLEKQNILIDNTILEILCNGNYNIDEIKNILSQKELDLTTTEIYHHLINLKQRLTLLGPSFESLPPKYKLNAGNNATNSEFLINFHNESSYLDIILVSDLHINSKDNIDYKIDDLYNYATKRGIKIIINLGDTFQTYITLREKNLYAINGLEELINKVRDIFPTNTGIYHMFLGGNHDQEILDFGIDPLDKLTMPREDLINLGYANKLLVFGPKTNQSNTLMLHHPNQKFKINQANANFKFSLVNRASNIQVPDYLSSFYQTKGLSQEDIYCNLLGHTHLSKLDIDNSYCLVPSYTNDRQENGAWHLRIYFDKNKEITNITFIPLILKDKLIPVTEINYKKIRKI